MRDLRSLLVSAAAAAASAGAASAQAGYWDYSSEPSHELLDPRGFSSFVDPMFEDAGYASASAVRHAVGGLSIEPVCSSNARSSAPDLKRSVRIYLDGGSGRLPSQAVTNTLASAALSLVYRECPMRGHGLGLLELYGPRAPDGSRDLLLRAEKFHGVGARGWEQVIDTGAERAAAADRERGQAEKTQRDFARTRAGMTGYATTGRTIGDTSASMFWLAAAGLMLVSWFLWSMSEAIAYCFKSRTRHSATGMIERAVRGRANIDGQLFAEIMRPVPESRTEQKVRADQAAHLVAMARAATERHNEQLARERDKAVEDAAFIRAQDELRRAVEEHELARARLDALRKWRDRHAK